LANYKYFNMDDAILNALELFEQDTNGQKWKNHPSISSDSNTNSFGFEEIRVSHQVAYGTAYLRTYNVSTYTDRLSHLSYMAIMYMWVYKES
jgi:hypothetical protein